MTLPLITEHFDLWTSTVRAKSTSGRGSNSKIELAGIKKLRELILELAVRGKLVPQDPNDEPASVLLARIEEEKTRLVAEGKLKKQKPLPPVSDEEKPFELPEGWEWIRLTHIAEINPRNEASDDLQVSFVPMALISTSHRGEHEQETREWREVKQGFTHFANGDVAIAKITPCFENSKAAVFSNLKNGIGAGTTELHVARPLGGLSPLYLLLCFKSPRYLLEGESKMTGSAGQKRLPKSYFEGTPLPLPPLSEQHRIVAKVDELMALCDQLEQQTEHQLEAHKQLVETLLESLTRSTSHAELVEAWQRLAAHFDLLFSGPMGEWAIDRLKDTILQLAVMGKLVPQNPDDEPASVLLARIEEEKARLVAEGKLKKQMPLPPVKDEEKQFELPTGWEWVRFGALVSFEAELVRPEDHLDLDQVAPDSIEKGTGKLLFRRTVKEAGIKGPNNRFYKGQILYSKIRPSLSKAIIAEFDGLCSADMYPLRAIGVSKEFLLQSILSEPFLVQVRREENRIKMPKLNMPTMSMFVIALPPITEQHRIVTKVNELFSLCDQLKSKLQAANETQLNVTEAIVEQALA